MDSRTCKHIGALLIVMILVPMLDGQETTPAARSILSLTEGEQIAFINRTLELGLPHDRADQMTMLVINRNAITIPIIEAKLEDALKSTESDRRFIDTAGEMIAYAGDDQALRAVTKLVMIDEGRFGPLVKRTLENAGNWRNPFTIVYKAFEQGNDAIGRRAAEWAEGVIESDRMRRAWAEAMLDRYGRLPVETDWARDPIASRLKNGTSAELRQRVTAFASEARNKR